MFGNNTYTGLALEGRRIFVATVQKKGKTIKLLHLDTYELAENAASEQQKVPVPAPNTTSATASAAGSDDVFGFNDGNSKPDTGNDEVDFEDLEAQALEQTELDSLDMVNEADGKEQSNEAVLYNILMDADRKSVQLGLNITFGNVIYQTISDTNFKEVKAKDLKEDLETKLETLYDQPPSPDHYAYEVREDGTLILASTDGPPQLVTITDEAKEIYNGKLHIRSVYPDEVALVGLTRANYDLEDDQYTALIQFGTSQCRIVFLQGDQIYEVMPLVSQGTENSNFLNTVFSKLLFQLDTGKIARIDRIIIADNSQGEDAVNFFRQNFPDMRVENFIFNEAQFDAGKYDWETCRSFTSSIAAAWAAAGLGNNYLPELSFMPAYVQERQKIFKLEWHGLLLLILLFLSIPTINHFYQQNKDDLASMTSKIALTDSRIKQVQPIVERTNEIAQNLRLLTTKLSLLDSLSAGSKAWSTKLDMLNHGMKDIPNSWFTSMSDTKTGKLIQGYVMYRNRIPAIVDLFKDATLLNVSTENRRDRHIYKFSISVKQFAKDSAAYSPEKPQKINRLLNH